MSHYGVVPEIIRGIRLHFAKLIKGMSGEVSTKAQLGLGHAYSRYENILMLYQFYGQRSKYVKKDTSILKII